MHPLSNYPVGVTGREYAISGATNEWDDEEETCPLCDWTGPMHHEAHPEFGVWVWCSQSLCEGNRTGFDGNKDPDYDDEPDNTAAGHEHWG